MGISTHVHLCQRRFLYSFGLITSTAEGDRNSSDNSLKTTGLATVS